VTTAPDHGLDGSGSDAQEASSDDIDPSQDRDLTVDDAPA
jgi:hypothetical protein